jgi:hypothetical protein
VAHRSECRRPLADRPLEFARPAGAGGVPHQHAAELLEAGARRAGGEPAHDCRAIVLAAGQCRQIPRQLPTRGPCRRADVPDRGGGLAHQQRDELVAAAAAHVLTLRLGRCIAVDRVGGELIDVGEDRLGQETEDLRVELGLAADPGEVAPSDASANPVGSLQRVQRAALAQLAATEGDVDLPPQAAAGIGIANQGDELLKRLADAGADPATEAPLERACVLGHLAGDRREDLRGHGLELRLDQVGDRARKAAPGL